MDHLAVAQHRGADGEAAIAPLAGATTDTPGVAPIPFRGTLTLGDDFTPGLYTLQVDVAPEIITGKKSRPVRQWVDFEVR